MLFDLNLAFVYKTISMLSGSASTVALLALGGIFRFSAVSRLKYKIIVGVLVRTILCPLICLSAAYMLAFLLSRISCFVCALWNSSCSFYCSKKFRNGQRWRTYRTTCSLDNACKCVYSFWNNFCLCSAWNFKSVKKSSDLLLKNCKNNKSKDL